MILYESFLRDAVGSAVLGERCVLRAKEFGFPVLSVAGEIKSQGQR